MEDKILKKILYLIIIFNLLINLPLISFSADNAISFANKAHSFYQEKDYLNAAKYYDKAIEISPKKILKENAVVSYSSYAQGLVNQGEYTKALEIMEKAFRKYPSAIKIKEQISDIYYYRSTEYFYVGKFDNARSDIENSMKFAVVEDQKLRAKENTDKINCAISQNLTPMTNPETSFDFGISETLSILENKVFDKTNDNLEIEERIKKLEKQTLKQNFPNESVSKRVERLKVKIAPNYFVTHAQKSQTSINAQHNYISQIIDQSDGKVSVFGKMPVKVYIETSNTTLFKKEYKDVVVNAFSEWGKATNDLIKFEYVNNPSTANIKVNFKETQEEYPWKPTLKTVNINEKEEKAKYKKASKMVNIASIATMVAGSLFGVPFIGSIGALGQSVASPLLAYKSMDTETTSPDLIIGLADINTLGSEKAKSLLKRRCLHQIGHSLGIYGHSPDPSDIMYVDYAAEQVSERDINTINEIYKTIK
jgi:predicted Zn-dependent protease